MAGDVVGGIIERVGVVGIDSAIEQNRKKIKKCFVIPQEGLTLQSNIIIVAIGAIFAAVVAIIKKWLTSTTKGHMAANKNTKGKFAEQDKERSKREHRLTFRLNDLEMKALTKYYKKYKVKNKARFLRETIMHAILKKFDEDYPTLFEVPEPVKESGPTLF
jgi:hypothetical protein